MALVTSAEQLAGAHLSTYEDYWKQADPKSTGSLPASDAATFLKKSGLDEVILSKIWELSDSGGKGYLDKLGFFRSLKLIALVQGGQEASLGNLALTTAPPNLGPVNMNPATTMATNWRITTHEKSKYDGIFQNLQPIDGKVAGDRIRPVLMNSNLPVELLGKVWVLSDHNKDGQLDSEEFAVAMHLVYQCLEKKPLPPTLPADLIPPSQQTHLPVGGVQVLPPLPTLNTGSSVASEATSASLPSWNPPQAMPGDVGNEIPEEIVSWVVSPQFLLASDHKFSQIDTDMDGLVNGVEVRDVLLQSGLPQQTLASIWGLCDIRNNGFLNKEQFALAQWLIEEKRMRGKDPPPQLSPDMIPPSLRGADNSIQANAEASSELLQIEAEIEEIKRKKIQLEADKQQRDADLRIRSGEVQTLQKEYEAISSTNQQLERQRGEAQKKLDELEDQKNRFHSEVVEIKEKCAAKQRDIDELDQKLKQQDRLEKDQANELNRLRNEYSQLQSEAMRLEKEIETNNKQFEQLKVEAVNTNAEISQLKEHVDLLTKLNEDIEAAIKQYQALIDNEPGAVEPDISRLQQATPSIQPITTSNRSSPVNQKSNTFGDSDFSNAFADFGAFGSKANTMPTNDAFGFSSSKSDPFASTDPFPNSTFEQSVSGDAFAPEPFGKEDPFKSDPFASSDPFKDSSSLNDDPFGGSDPFGSSSNIPKHPASQTLPSAITSSRPKSTDPFSSDPFGDSTPQPVRSASAVPPANDIFDPFNSAATANTGSSSFNDPFGFDPFPSNKPDDSKKKVPPPRPALPRPKAPSPTESSSKPIFNPDPFKMDASSTTSKKGVRPKAVTPNEDPFGGFGADPFGGSDPFASKSNGDAMKSDPFAANFADFGSGFTATANDKDLSWAQSDGEKLEAERKRRLAEQEKADFEFALALSKAES